MQPPTSRESAGVRYGRAKSPEERRMATTFTVGGLRVDRIIESEGPFLGAKMLFPGLTDEELERQRPGLEGCGALVPGGDVLVLTVQSYVVRTPRHTILVDTCVGNHKTFPRRPEWHNQTATTYIDALARAGLGVGDIDIVLCTHLHVDHVGWNTRLLDGRWAPTFPNARYLFGRTEYDHWERENARTPDNVFRESVLPVVEAGRVTFVASDAAIDDHVRLLPTPGHTPGHHAVLLGRDRDEAMVTGDIMHSPLQVARPDLSPVFDADPVQSAATRRQVLERLCETRMLCCTAHFPSPSVIRIARDGANFRCETAL